MLCGLSYMPGLAGAGSLEECSQGAAATSACWPGARLPSCLHSAISHPQHILYCIVDSECKSRDVLQSYFDLLGELMKFNVDAFKRFNKYINTDAKVRPAQGSVGFALLFRSYLGALVLTSPWSWFYIGEAREQAFISISVPGVSASAAWKQV